MTTTPEPYTGVSDPECACEFGSVLLGPDYHENILCPRRLGISDPPEDIAALNATVANINQRVELLGMADLIDDLYVWLVTITGTPESDILEEARAVMSRYRTRHAERSA